MKDATARRLSRWHTTVFRASGGRIGKRLVRNDMLLVTTTGRRSGRPHTVPLLYLRDGNGVIVFASWGGRDVHPEWYQNLLATPEAAVELPGERFWVTAEILAGAERSKWWERAERAYNGYAVYQSRTEREIPVVRLRRTTR